MLFSYFYYFFFVFLLLFVSKYAYIQHSTSYYSFNCSRKDDSILNFHSDCLTKSKAATYYHDPSFDYFLTLDVDNDSKEDLILIKHNNCSISQRYSLIIERECSSTLIVMFDYKRSNLRLHETEDSYESLQALSYSELISFLRQSNINTWIVTGIPGRITSLMASWAKSQSSFEIIYWTQLMNNNKTPGPELRERYAHILNYIRLNGLEAFKQVHHAISIHMPTKVIHSLSKPDVLLGIIDIYKGKSQSSIESSILFILKLIFCFPL